MVWKVAILTCSDSRSQGLTADTSAQVIRELVEEELQGEIIAYRVVPDELQLIRSQLIELADHAGADLIFTTGGIGLNDRDVTPDATKLVVDQQLPGIAEVIRQACVVKTPRAMFTRGIAGLRKHVLIINLAGTPKVTFAGLNAIMDQLPYALQKLQHRKDSGFE